MEPPRFPGRFNLLALVDAIAEARERGWLRIGATLISGDLASQKRFAKYILQLAADTRKDGGPHSATIPGGSRFSDSFVLTFATGGARESFAAARAHLADYNVAKKHRLGVAMGAVLLFNSEQSPSL